MVTLKMPQLAQIEQSSASLSCFLSVHCIKQTDSKLPCVCSVIDHRRRQNVGRTSVTFLFLLHFDVICDLLLNRRIATWNLFVKLIFQVLVTL